MRLSSAVWSILISLLLTGCGTPDALFDDYLKRLERTLNVSVPGDTQLSLPRYPAHRDLAINIPDTRLTLIEAWDLNHCELFGLIGERNSILGKLSEPEIRFDYEQRLLNSLPPCIEHVETTDEAADMLQQVLNNKELQLPAALWNATFAGADFSHLFSLSERAFKVNEPLDIEIYQDTLQSLNGLIQKNAVVDLAELNRMAKLSSEFALAGSVLQSQRVAIVSLSQANQMLEQAIAQQTLCPDNRPKPELDIARNVLVKVFIGRIQPWLVRVTDGYRAGFVSNQQLLENFSLQETTPVEDYMSKADAINNRYLDTIRRHTALWEELFRNCGLSVN